MRPAARPVTQFSISVRRPVSLLVLGGGPVAVELGQFFGSNREQGDHPATECHTLVHMDEDVGRALEASFREEGIEVVTDVSLQSVTRTPSEKTVHYMQEAALQARSGEYDSSSPRPSPQSAGFGP